MLIQSTCDRLEAIGLTGTAQALHEPRRAAATFESLSVEERLCLLIDHEVAKRDTKRRALATHVWGTPRHQMSPQMCPSRYHREGVRSRWKIERRMPQKSSLTLRLCQLPSSTAVQFGNTG